MKETIDCLFLRCNYFGNMWHLILDWLGFSSVKPDTLADQFLQFSQTCGFQRSIRRFIYLMWFSCVWTIWKEKNNIIFDNKEVQLSQLLDKIKLQSF